MFTIRLCLVLSLFLLPATRTTLPDDLDHLTVEGAVTDATGAAIAGAQITALRTMTGVRRIAVAAADGRYRLSALPPGSYVLTVEAPGFHTSVAEGVSGSAGATIRRDFRLALAALVDQMTINAAESIPGAIDTTRTVVGATIDRDQIDALPIESRNPLDLLLVLAGVAPPAFYTDDLAPGDTAFQYRPAPEEAGIFSLSGGTPFSNNLTIEGLDNNDDRGARERFAPSPDAVEEVQVIANQFSAEYGRASGGRVNLRLRGGANNWRGRGFYFFRDARLNANAFHRNADPARAFRLPFTEQNPGASMGGPLLKDRLFFFTTVEHNRVSDEIEISALVPTTAHPALALPRPNAAGGGANLGALGTDRNGRPIVVNGGAEVGLYDLSLSTPKNATTIQSRVDLNLGERHRLFALMTQARQRDERGFPGGRRMLETLRASGRDSLSLAFSETFIISSRAVSQTRIQVSRLLPRDAPASTSPVVLIEIDDPRDVAGNADANPFSRTGTLVAGASTTGGTDRRESRRQVQQTFDIQFRTLSLRSGFDVQHISSQYRDLADATGTFTFSTPADFLAGRFARYEHRFNTSSELRNTYVGLFLQGDWRIKPTLLVAAGLRWDGETILRDRNNFGPRISVAWNPGGSNRQVLRAGYGMFYNRALLRTLDDFTLTSQTVLVDTNLPAARSLLDDLRFPGVLAAQDARIAAMGVRETSFLRRLEPGFRLPESVQASAGYEREIGRGLKVEVNYVFNRGAHLWREVNVNAPRLPSGYADFAGFLLSRDFDNSRDPATGERPITTTGNADVVRFADTTTPNQTIIENGRRIIVFGLAQTSTSNATSGRRAALAAVRYLRPDPEREQIEELQSRGNSFYHGLSVVLTGRIARRGFLRAGYTLSRMVDDGVVNTSSPLVPGDFRRERSLSLLDARHRLTFAGQATLPRRYGEVVLAGTFQLHSPQPFNLGINGNDRNLDDVNNDRPDFRGDLSAIRWRAPGEMLDPTLSAAFSLPLIGAAGNLPRNAGRGPWGQTLNLRLSRVFRIGERFRLTPKIEAFNPFNSTVFRFGAEFVDYTPNTLGAFLIPRRTVRPRTVRVGVRVDF